MPSSGLYPFSHGPFSHDVAIKLFLIILFVCKDLIYLITRMHQYMYRQRLLHEALTFLLDGTELNSAVQNAEMIAPAHRKTPSKITRV